MWTLSGFADEIDPDPKTQFATLNDLGITHVEFRSAWGTNVLDLTDEQIESAAAILAMIVFITYPLTDQRFREVRDETETRKRELEHAILGDRGTV